MVPSPEVGDIVLQRRPVGLGGKLPRRKRLQLSRVSTLSGRHPEGRLLLHRLLHSLAEGPELGDSSSGDRGSGVSEYLKNPAFESDLALDYVD